MNLDEPAERDAAAAEYVLGTLRGPERRQFARRLADDRELQQAVRSWEARLADLAALVPPEPPPPELWPRIERELAVGAAQRNELEARAARAAALLRERVRRWQIGAGAAAALAAALGAFVIIDLVRPPAPAPTPLIAVLQPGDAAPGWLIRTAPEGAAVLPISEPALEPDRSFELWFVPGEGAPVSLGLLDPARATVLSLPPEQRARLAPGAVLAVSLEPAGGSPTGVATGPIVFQGRLAEAAGD